MADERIRQPVKITDPTTDANEAGVDASGNLQVILAANTGVDVGDVDVLSLPTSPDTIAEDTAFGAGAAVFPMGVQYDDTTPNVLDEGDIGAPRCSVNRNVYTTIRDHTAERGAGVDASNNLQVILAANTGVDIGDVDVLSVIPGTGATNLGKAENAASAGGDVGVAAMAIQDAALSALGSVDGDYTHLRVDANGALHVTGGGGGTEYTEDAAAPADPIAGALSLVRQDTPAGLTTADGDIVTQRGTNFGAGFVQVLTSAGAFVDDFSAAAPAGEARAHSSSTDTAAGGTLDADTADFGGVTKKLAQVDAWASVPYKATIMSVSNGTETILDVLGGKAGESLVWNPPHKDYYEVAFSANAGFDGFRVEMTNLDNSQAANLYATLYTED